MQQVIDSRPYNGVPLLMYTLTSVIITMSLFYVDEGYYDFRWMKNVGNWIAFLIYGTAILTGQVLLFLLFTRVFRWKVNNLVVILFGASLSILFLVTIVFG